MNAKTLLLSLATVAVSAAIAGNAFAQEATPDYPTPYVATKTRAEVRSEYLQARAAGLIPHGEATLVVAPTESVLSRAQVAAEARAAARLGLNSRGEAGAIATQAQLEQIRIAGLSLLETTFAVR